MAVPLLIAKKEESDNPCLNDYKIGWLYINEKGGYWATWSNGKSKEAALQCAKEIIKVSGKTDVYITDASLTEQLTKEQILTLEKLNIKIIEEITFY